MPVTSQDPTVRLARREDGTRCNDFYNRHYKRSRSLEQWEWEFARPSQRSDTIPFAVAEYEGEVVGTQALIPIELIDSAGPYWSAKSEETLLAESMRGRGLFHRLYEPLLAFALEHRLESIWGFTPARAAFEREGFSFPARTSQLVRAFTSRAAEDSLAASPQVLPRKLVRSAGSLVLSGYGLVASALRRFRIPRQIELRTLERAPEWMDKLSVDFNAQWGGTTIHRTAAYAQWRMFENPFRRPTVVAAFVEGTPVGWVAFGIGDSGTAALVDVVAVRPPDPLAVTDVITALIAESAERTRDMGASAIRAWHVSQHQFSVAVRASARRLGWVRVNRGFDMVLKFTPGIPPRPDAQPIDKWYVTRIYNEGSDL